MKKQLKHILVIIAVCISTIGVYAQQVNSMYFLDNAPVRHYLNPAFQPLSNFYLGIPILGYTQYGMGNNSFTVHSLTLDKNGLYNAIKPTTLFRTDLQINLLDFGFRTKDSYWSFGLTEKMDAQLGLPKDLFKFALYGTPDVNNNIYNFSSLNFGVNFYTEAAFGYSRTLNDQWTVGGKLKGLFGTANISAKFDNFDMTASIDEWTMKANGAIRASSPALIQVDNNFGVTTGFDTMDPMDFTKPSGLGAAVDLGASYKPLEALTISAAITDLGMIRWTKNVNSATLKSDFKFDGLGSFTADDFSDDNFMDAAVDTLLDRFKKATTYDITNTAYSTSLSPKLNIGAEYGFFENRLTVGLLSRTMFQKKSVYEELTGSVNYRPKNWFNMALSYSALNGRFSNIGAGIGLRVGIVQGFISADYIPLRSTRMPLSVIGLDNADVSGIPVISGMANNGIPIAYKTDRFNVAFGVNIVIGNKQDKDKDGVKDKRDKCPDTPRGVIVDEFGCPVDSDGDGVPDYLDECPNTPVEARGLVNDKGCPIDSDGDGVADYLDRCPETPSGVTVDEFGCPVDSDGDGVPDYLDLCPDTPAEARGLVDKNGCPIDSDGDGVPDYLDLCPNTPVEARATVDKNGCPLDSDDDGVPDYLDKCPDTPVEARGMVDENGCPRDTDGDGIPDYLDDCPKVAGPASNKGCPEIKKEIRTLFQKALQGIQFETGKALIKKNSHTILNQIAKVLNDNPTYLVEVQGHTDNVGKEDMNQSLSENRANSVRNYLIDKGVSDSRITANGYGDTKPVAPNTTSQGRAKNRRVEFVISFEEVKFEKVTTE